MKEYTLLSSARQSQNYIHCCIPRSFYLPFRCYAGIYQSSCHIVYKPDWIRTLKWNGLVVRVVVSCIRSTSNHNYLDCRIGCVMLFPVSVLHQTTTTEFLYFDYNGCFLYPFYIKPQHLCPLKRRSVGLFPVSVLHQTTTETGTLLLHIRCFLYPFYIKPQPSVV